MIVIEEHEDLLKVHVYGELTLEDFKEFEESVNRELLAYEKLNLLLDLSEMNGFTLDAALEEIQFNRRHIGQYKKIAVVTSDQWIAWVSWLATVFTGAEVQKLPNVPQAESWIKA